MDFRTFTDTMKDIIKDYLPDDYKDAKVEIYQHQKLNEQYTGLSVRREDQRVTPTVNMESLYKEYNREGRSISDMAKEVAKMIQMEPPGLDINRLLDYEKAKESLYIRVSNAEQNQDMLENAPHMLYEDLAVTYHIAAQMDEDGLASTLVTDNLLAQYGITQEQLHEDAMKNAPQILPARVESMGEVMRRMMRSDMLSSGMDEETMEAMLEDMAMVDDTPMTVVSNDRGVNGASALFYPGQLDVIAEKLEGDFFILPSSIHESLVVPDDGNFSYHELQNMVEEVNSTQVHPSERLSDEVYHYDSKDRVFEKAASFEKRQQEKANVKATAKQKEAEHGEAPKAPKKHQSNDMSL